jgi:peroxiredoxin
MELLEKAPDFTLNTFEGTPVRLSDYRGNQSVVLVFNRGFT